MGVVDIRFAGLSAPVRCVDCEHTLEGLTGYIPRWPFDLLPMSPADYGPVGPAATLAFNGAAWLVQSPHTPDPRIHKTEVNAICDLLSILASALIAELPDMLCFHAAALQADDGLILFPALRRSGKSTLAAVLMARGLRLFTDDYLPVSVPDTGALIGQATGLAARLRLPLPDTMPTAVLAYADANPGPANTQYRYLAGPQLAAHGDTAPIQSIVLLDRQDAGPASLSPVTEGAALAALAKQNFSRGQPAGDTLSALTALIATAPPVRLTYSDPDEAADLILAGLPRATGTAPQRRIFPTPGTRPDTQPLDPGIPYRVTPFADLAPAGDIWVGASCDGERILQFDALAVAVLDLLADPLTPDEVTTLIQQTLPHVPAEDVATNTASILSHALKVGYIARA